jgi:phosphomannomutase
MTHLQAQVGLDARTLQGVTVFYDALYATGRNVFPRLLQQAGVPHVLLHTEDTPPASYTGMPNPTATTLVPLGNLMQQSGPTTAAIKLGLSNDGDADRFGVLDETGTFVPTNDVLLLVLYGLTHLTYPGQPHVLVRSQATSHALDALAALAQWPVIQTPVGYKYIAETFIAHANTPDALPVGLGAEASGGLSVAGHIPEKDGIVADLLVARLVSQTQTPVSQLIRQVRQLLPQAYAFREISAKTDQGNALLTAMAQLGTGHAHCEGMTVDVDRTQAAAAQLTAHFAVKDGIKLYLTDNSWILFRQSGTEPLIRLVCEAVAATDIQANQKLTTYLVMISKYYSTSCGFSLLPDIN